MYGPTETTVWSTCSQVTSRQEIHIGRPIDNTDVYIVDARLQPVPVGVVGELLIGGDGLARGYLKRPELTAEKFIPHPFKPQGRVYRTGDLARFRADGTIVCLGRVDSQVKIRGFRIELGEIEAVLARQPGVIDAVVAVHDSPQREQQLVAYVVLHMGTALSADELRRGLREDLPEYMLPTAFVPLERVPLTPNGKIDRRALPVPTADQLAPVVGGVAPRNATEARLAELLAEVLGLDSVGITDDFFVLGGHSLLAVRFFAEIERRFGRKLPLASLFASPTVEGLARELDGRGPDGREWSSLVPIREQGTKPRLFFVHGAGGNVLLFRDFVESLGADYPLYAFQSQGLDGQATPLTTVEEMAAHYVSELTSFQAQGPYCLGGYCLGGLVAYEMARLLRQRGDDVSIVALLDTYNPASVRPSSRIGMLWQRAKFHCANVMSLRPREIQDYLKEKIRVARDGELWNLTNLNGADRAANSGGGSGHVQRINDRAAELYRPQSYDGSVTLLKPQVNYSFYPDPRMGWGDLVKGELDIVVLPVNPHAMLVTPFVTHLVDALRERLDQASTGRPAATAARNIGELTALTGS
jgi:aspartate racemase